MAAYVVSADEYREIDRKMIEIKRKLSEPDGSPLEPGIVARRLQLILDAPTPAPIGSTTPAEAAAIMGSAFHGVDALALLLGLDPSPVETAQLAAIPFSSEALARSRETHLLVACTRFSIMGLRATAPRYELDRLREAKRRHQSHPTTTPDDGCQGGPSCFCLRP